MTISNPSFQVESMRQWKCSLLHSIKNNQRQSGPDPQLYGNQVYTHIHIYPSQIPIKTYNRTWVMIIS
ncbi:predicted protein [Lichtheimia corymbifera JMRC:FSU:9682]|uniref:Uncharacterized protein n=1 Tax=Lichtheimia corymbifera JMRC:FSU:9682 TaxID=1263082 RepID=A0A068RU17_9FUNG|nr:predicted protein [Lichtheimia corymbifera JMRC:FSU:9682]